MTTRNLLLFLVCALLETVADSFTSSSQQQQQPYRNILILDHLNINHQKSRHDQLKAFYFYFLQCGIDPRKVENIEKGKKTLWANIGAQQFHLPEGKPDAQVLQGEIRLCYPKESFQQLIQAYEDSGSDTDSDGGIQEKLKGSHFDLKKISSHELKVTDPWGSKFAIVSSEKEKDGRGIQDNYDKASLGTCMDDLTIYTPSTANMAGIARFYEQILDAPILELSTSDESAGGGGRCVVSMGPYQTLTFQSVNDNGTNKGGIPSGLGDVNMHVDLRDEPESNPPDQEFYPSNYGPHISIYISDIRGTYKRAEALGVTYVNPRFKRRAYSEDEVVKDCMFRCLDIVDPENIEAGAILRLEHEVRSVLKEDGALYKSCPFDQVPEGCII